MAENYKYDKFHSEFWENINQIRSDRLLCDIYLDVEFYVVKTSDLEERHSSSEEWNLTGFL